MLYRPTSSVSSILPDTRHRPALNELCSQLTTFRSGDIEYFKPYVDRLLRSIELRHILDDDMRALANDPTTMFAWVTAFRYTIFQNSNYTLRLLIGDPPGSRVNLATAVSAHLFAVLTPGITVTVDRYDLPATTQVEVFDPNVELHHKSHALVTAAEGAIPVHAFEVTAIVAPRRVLTLALTEVPALPYAWEFDRRSLRPLLIEGVAPAITRLEVAVNILAGLAAEDDASEGVRASCIRALTDLARNPHHFVRWKATQALYQLDLASGMRALRAAQNDAHPHVRQAARTSLRKLSEANPVVA